MSNDKYAPPTETLGDHAHTAIRSALSFIPLGDGAAVELFQTVVVPPLKKRQQMWMKSVAEALNELEGRQRCVIEDLTNNDAFIDTICQASQAAVRTSQQQKLDALRNAVLNSALPNAPDETLRQIFVTLIDAFSPLHLLLLSFLDDPKAWYERHGRKPPNEPKGTVLELVLSAFPDLKQQDAICDHVCKDLHSRGLLIVVALRDDVARYPYFPQKERIEQAGYGGFGLPGIGSVVYSGQPTALREWTTGFGRQFLAFIAAP